MFARLKNGHQIVRLVAISIVFLLIIKVLPITSRSYAYEQEGFSATMEGSVDADTARTGARMASAALGYSGGATGAGAQTEPSGGRNVSANIEVTGVKISIQGYDGQVVYSYDNTGWSGKDVTLGPKSTLYMTLRWDILNGLRLKEKDTFSFEIFSTQGLDISNLYPIQIFATDSSGNKTVREMVGTGYFDYDSSSNKLSFRAVMNKTVETWTLDNGRAEGWVKLDLKESDESYLHEFDFFHGGRKKYTIKTDTEGNMSGSKDKCNCCDCCDCGCEDGGECICCSCGGNSDGDCSCEKGKCSCGKNTDCDCGGNGKDCGCKAGGKDCNCTSGGNKDCDCGGKGGSNCSCGNNNGQDCGCGKGNGGCDCDQSSKVCNCDKNSKNCDCDKNSTSCNCDKTGNNKGCDCDKNSGGCNCDSGSSKDESSKDESSKDESSKDESSKDESSKDGSSKDESSKDESSKDESSKDGSSKDESSKDGSSSSSGGGILTEGGGSGNGREESGGGGRRRDGGTDQVDTDRRASSSSGVPLTPIEDDDVPLAGLPTSDDPLVTIPDGDVPLSTLPSTGTTHRGVPAAVLLAVFSGLVMITCGRKR